MLIGVFSDTHDNLTYIDRAIELFTHRRVQAVIHAGDIVAPFAAKRLLVCPVPLYVIYGNNDGERHGLHQVLPQIKDGPLKLELGGRQLLIHHALDWCRQEDILGADVIITGHTHEIVNDLRDGKLFLNPGECCGWVNDYPTAAILDTDTMSAEIVKLTGTFV